MYRNFINKILLISGLLFQLQAILRAILKDEIIALHKKRLIDERHAQDQSGTSPEGTSPDRPTGSFEVDTERVIAVVEKAVLSIMSRLNGLSHFEKSETNKMTQLVQAASNPDNLCCMDPTWHPWF